jgi:hypothetical protein
MRKEERRREADVSCGCSYNGQTGYMSYYSVPLATMTITTNYSHMCVLTFSICVIIIYCGI